MRKSSSTDSTSNKPAASHKSSYTATKTKTAAKAETRNEQETSRFESVLRILPLHLYKVFCWIIGMIAHFSVDVYDNGANSFTIMSTILFLIALYFAYFKNEKRLRKIPMLMFSVFTYYSLKYIHTIWMYVG